MQWNKDTILKVIIVGKPAGQLNFFLICQEFKQKSPANMNVATQISIDISREKRLVQDCIVGRNRRKFFSRFFV